MKWKEQKTLVLNLKKYQIASNFALGIQIDEFS